MITQEMIDRFKNNPQMMEQLAQSPLDPNAILAYQMGGPMPEVPGVTMGQPGAAQAPVQNPIDPNGPTGNPVSAVPPPKAFDWASLGGSGQEMMQQAQGPQMGVGQSPMMRIGDSNVMQAGNYSTRGPGKPSSLEDILAGFRK